MSKNKDQKTVDGFGDEWERFDQSQLNWVAVGYKEKV